MPSGLANFVLETATNPGTGSFMLNGAPLGRVAFSSVFLDGQKVFYFADDGTQAEWGVGTLSTSGAASLVRATIAGNTLHTLAPLNFTGTVQVYNEIPASFLPILEADGSLILQALTVRGDAIGQTAALGDNSTKFATTEYIRREFVRTRPSDDGVNSPVSYLAYFDGNGVPWLSVAKSSGTFNTSLVQTNPGGGFYKVVNLTLNAQGQPIYVSSGGGTTQGITTFSDANTTMITQAGYQHTNDYLSFNASGSWILGATQSWTAGQIANEATARANTDAGLQSQINVRVSTRPSDDGTNSPVSYLAYFDGNGVPWLSVAKSSGTFNTSLVQTNPGGGFYEVVNLTLNAQGQPIYVSSGGGTTQGITTFSDANTSQILQIGYQHTNDYLSFNVGGSWVLGATQSWAASQIANEATARANTDAGLQSQINQRVTSSIGTIDATGPILGGVWARHGNILHLDFRVRAQFGDVIDFPLPFTAGSPTVTLTAQAYSGEATTANVSGDPSLTNFTFISSYWHNSEENNSGPLTLHVSAKGWG